MFRVSVVAPSSVVPKAELAMGVKSLRAAGFDVRVHPQCGKRDLFFAGSHEVRAQALLEESYREDVDIIWCARGGYGSNHLLRYLDLTTRKRGTPRRAILIVGLSDATSLLEFARERWGFSVLHGPMPGLKSFLLLSSEERSALYSWVRGTRPQNPWGKVRKLRWLGGAPKRALSGELVGGNLTVWNTLLGTPFQPAPKSGRILFLEDVTETLPRLDRAVRHLVDAGGLRGVRAIVLGNFLSCEDAVPQVLGREVSELGEPLRAHAEKFLRSPPASALVPLRKKFSQSAGLRRIFETVARELGIPVACGLPVGHGPEHFSLPLGAQVRLEPDGTFTTESWGWLDKAPRLR